MRVAKLRHDYTFVFAKYSVMVIYDLDILSISLGPSEADAPLVVDANAHLPCPIPFQR
jgi:hypothetical protein